MKFCVCLSGGLGGIQRGRGDESWLNLPGVIQSFPTDEIKVLEL